MNDETSSSKPQPEFKLFTSGNSKVYKPVFYEANGKYPVRIGHVYKEKDMWFFQPGSQSPKLALMVLSDLVALMEDL